jgi:hypothetical protein
VGAPKRVPTLVEFAAMARRGKVHKAVLPKEDLANILAKKVPAVSLEIIGISHSLSEQYESGALQAELEKNGLFVDDDRMGMLYAATSLENLAAIKNAETPLEYARAFGYTDDDAAAFYLKRRGGNVAVGYADFISDWTPRS